jgi:hypothetical protein
MKGILFKEMLFRKVISGEKTQTRRMVDPQPICLQGRCNGRYIGNPVGDKGLIKSRYKVGDTAYLKEPYKLSNMNDFGFDLHLKYSNSVEKELSWEVIKQEHKISHNKMDDIISSISRRQEKSEWLNKMFMPEWCARHFIKITGVRCELLQDISDEDCLKEGIVKEIEGNGAIYAHNYYDNGTPNFGCASAWNYTPKITFSTLIDKINGKGTWESNAYVWIYDFELLK